jgi:hypothetical protein
MDSLYIEEHTLSFSEVNIRDKEFLKTFREVNSALFNLGADLEKI